jgi:hypothetical protein
MEPDVLNLTSALAGNKTLTSDNMDTRRRSVRLADKSNSQ